MTFARLREFLEEESGCTIDHIGKNFYYARNCISGGRCVIQDLNFYDTPTLCHYFYELGTDIPEDFVDFAHVYMNLREHIKGQGIAENRR